MKSTKIYSKFWTVIKILCLELYDQSLEVKFLHLDIENSAPISDKNIFPHCQIIGCRFHLNQSWFRKIQSSKHLLKHYPEKTDTGVWLHHFFGFSFLLSDEVELGFVELISIAPPDVIEFTDYILDNYIFKN